MFKNFRSGGRPVLATNLLAQTGALNIMVCYSLSSGQPFFEFSLSPLILSMILSMTSWGHLADILETSWGHMGPLWDHSLSSLGFLLLEHSSGFFVSLQKVQKLEQKKRFGWNGGGTIYCLWVDWIGLNRTSANTQSLLSSRALYNSTKNLARF